MGLSHYYAGLLIRRTLPTRLFVRLMRIRRVYESRRRERAQTSTIACHGRFGVDQLRKALISSAGIRKAGVLLVQSSFGRFYNFDGTAEDMLSILEELVGPEGTLMMPAFPPYRREGPFIFDVRKAPAQTGLLCELFRRRSGVMRSLHPTHSVCARGPLAETLLAEHHQDPLSCGPLSPYAKLAQYNGQILGLGLPPGYTTFLHVVEDCDLERYPRRTYLEKPVEFTVIDETGRQFILSLCRRDPRVGATLNLTRVVRHLSKQSLRSFSIHGVPAFLAHATPLLRELDFLRDQGIILYA